MESRYLNFIESGKTQTGKTKIYTVTSKNNLPLGIVKWFGNWRKYCFFTNPNAILDEICLREITEFLVTTTQEHKDKYDMNKLAESLYEYE